MIPVNEIFQTIQGEGFHAGRPAVFIRLQGCPVGCPWCDTKFTWDTRMEDQVTAGAMLTKDHSGDATWAPMTEAMIVEQVMRNRARHVVITGGEPAMHDLTDLSAALLFDAKRTVQIETSGTFPIRSHPLVWVTVSPKLDMPGGYAVLDEALERANEIKMPIGKQDDVVRLIELLDRGVSSSAKVYLQPLSLSRRATDICVTNAIANNWRLSLQIHALAGWR